MYLNRKREQGNMIIIAVFIVVVMSMLAVNLVRINWSNQDTLARETLGTQAWFLANSANEWALTQLYPIGGEGSLTELETACSAINGNSDAPTELADGLPCADPVIECQAPAAALPDELRYFQVTSRAICGSGSIFQVQREQVVRVKVLEE